MAFRPFRIAETFKFDGVGGYAVLDKKIRHEFPIIAVASEPVDHYQGRPRGGRAPVPVKDIPLFASFHIQYYIIEAKYVAGSFSLE